MKKLLLVLCLIGLLQNAAMAQKRFVAPLAGTVVLKDVEDKYNAQVYNLEMPEPDGDKENNELEGIKAKIHKLYPPRTADRKNSAAAKTTAAQQPVISRAFVADSLGGIPPDNDMAINKNDQAVSVINSNIAVLNANTGIMNYRKALITFSVSVGLNGGPSSPNYRYDPKVMYDPENDRFICVMLNGTNQSNWIVFGFSQTNDPTGAWNFYKLYGNYGNDTTWFDYPTVAMTHNEFFLCGNKLVYNGSFQTGFVRSVIYQVRKADGYAGNPLTYQIWDTVNYGGRPIRNLYPAKGGAGIKGPDQYFVNVRNVDIQNDTVFLIKVPDTIGSVNHTLTVTPLVSNLNYGVPPNGRQKDPTVPLATNDGRVLGAYVEGNQIQFVTASVVTPTGASGVYHGIINNYNTTPTVTASMFTIDTLDFGYPNLSYAGNTGGNNHSIISFNYTGPTTFAGLGAIFYDGTQFSDLLKVRQGDSLIKVLTGDQRWGDYTGSQPDWNNIGCVWIEGIYGRKARDYGNYMARLRSPFFTAVAEETPAATDHKLYPNPTWQYIKVEFTLKHTAEVNFMIYDAAGKMVDKLTSSKCEEGRNIIQFNTSSLPPGMYFLKAQDNSGKSLMSKSFVRQ